MRAVTPTRTQTERADQTRARILDAAILQFGANGLAGARTEQIAEAAGVNKALLYYYFNSKETLYSAAIETVVEGTRAASMAVLEADVSAGERFLQIVLGNFDRTYSNPAFQSLMQQEMIRMHRGEANALALLAEKFIRPMWLKIREIVEAGVASGELISAEWSQMLCTALGANVLTPWSVPPSSFDAKQPSNIWGWPFLSTGSTGREWRLGCWQPRPCPNRRESKLKNQQNMQ
jgi:TetR/AcrR family transcriptional regulator